MRIMVEPARQAKPGRWPAFPCVTTRPAGYDSEPNMRRCGYCRIFLEQTLMRLKQLLLDSFRILIAAFRRHPVTLIAWLLIASLADSLHSGLSITGMDHRTSSTTGMLLSAASQAALLIAFTRACFPAAARPAGESWEAWVMALATYVGLPLVFGYLVPLLGPANRPADHFVGTTVSMIWALIFYVLALRVLSAKLTALALGDRNFRFLDGMRLMRGATWRIALLAVLLMIPLYTLALVAQFSLPQVSFFLTLTIPSFYDSASELWLAAAVAAVLRTRAPDRFTA